jgi:adenosylcobyric acid synthase
LPLDADLIILPGSKTTIADLEFLKAQHRDEELRVYARRGGCILGICAGYQMLGKQVLDPDRIEGERDRSRGLGLLDVETIMTARKVLRPVEGRHIASGASFRGYEMHLGETAGLATARPLLQFADGKLDGTLSADGRIAGCYVHGLFTDSSFRAAFLESLGARSAGEDHARRLDQALDEVAAVLERSVDLEAMMKSNS